MFTTFDTLFLFALHEEDCHVLPRVARRLDFGLSGAIIAELALQRRLGIITPHKLDLLDSAITGDDILDETLEEMAKLLQPRKFSYWVKHLGEGSPSFREKMFTRMVTRGVLAQKEEGYSWVIPFLEWPQVNASARYSLKNHLRELVLTHTEPELQELALLSMLKASRLLNLVFTLGERKAAKSWIYSCMMSRVMDNPVVQVLQEIEVALEAISANA